MSAIIRRNLLTERYIHLAELIKLELHEQPGVESVQVEVNVDQKGATESPAHPVQLEVFLAFVDQIAMQRISVSSILNLVIGCVNQDLKQKNEQQLHGMVRVHRRVVA